MISRRDEQRDGHQAATKYTHLLCVLEHDYSEMAQMTDWGFLAKEGSG